ncbi:YjfB family protein [Bacillus salitolerans]|uniref:YjfB family protein n=1 Tax=Bacillus salitolerans TaxID=1437434 RepID=A0ABW4LP42_9BACI
MDIAALSVMMSQANAKQSTDLSLLKVAMESAEQTGDNLTKMLEGSSPAPHPTLGKSIDLRG